MILLDSYSNIFYYWFESDKATEIYCLIIGNDTIADFSDIYTGFIIRCSYLGEFLDKLSLRVNIKFLLRIVARGGRENRERNYEGFFLYKVKEDNNEVWEESLQWHLSNSILSRSFHHENVITDEVNDDSKNPFWLKTAPYLWSMAVLIASGSSFMFEPLGSRTYYLTAVLHWYFLSVAVYRYYSCLKFTS